MTYRLDIADDMIRKLREVQAEAISAGQGPTFREGASHIFRRLQVAPLTVGEIQYRTSLGDPVHLVARGPLTLNFVIHENPPLVWIIKIERLLAAHE